MSWSIKLVGERAAVRQAVENSPVLPESVRKVILETIHEKVPEHSKGSNGISVEGYGHENKNDESSLGSIGKLEVVPFFLTK